MEAIAKLNHLAISARKVRLMANLIRGCKVSNALAILSNRSHRCSEPLRKLLLSALSNWYFKNSEENVDQGSADVVIKSITVDGGRMLKRIVPASRGIAHRIRRRSSHVTIVVDRLNVKS